MKEHCKEPSQSGVLIVGVGASSRCEARTDALKAAA
jgi:hypothetical protein